MANQLEHDYPIPVPCHLFDQKDEAFKRASVSNHSAVLKWYVHRDGLINQKGGRIT
jgi:hypothetical protein